MSCRSILSQKKCNPQLNLMKQTQSLTQTFVTGSGDTLAFVRCLIFNKERRFGSWLRVHLEAGRRVNVVGRLCRADLTHRAESRNWEHVCLKVHQIRCFLCLKKEAEPGPETSCFIKKLSYGLQRKEFVSYFCLVRRIFLLTGKHWW